MLRGSLNVICGVMFFLAMLNFCGCSKAADSDVLNVVMDLDKKEWRALRGQVFPLFEKKHNVKIRARQLEPEYLAVELKAGKHNIDIFAQDNTRLAELAEEGLLLDLSEYGREIALEIFPSLTEPCKFKNRLFFAPFKHNLAVTYYNQNVFEKYGLEAPRNWEELLAVARRFKEAEGEGRVFLKTSGSIPIAIQLYEFILQAGGDPYSFDDQGCIEAFSYLQELWPYISDELPGQDSEDLGKMLAGGQVYLGQGSPFGYIGGPFKAYSGWSGPAGEYHIITGDVLGISRDSQKKELAIEFIRYIHSKETQRFLFRELGWPSVRKDFYLESDFGPVSRAFEHGVFRQQKSPVWWRFYAKYITDAFREIVMQKAPVEETLKKYEKAFYEEKASHK